MKIKALVVDNNPVLLKAVSTILSLEDCQVLTAENGLEAIDIARKEYPDIIFTDLIMPLVGGEQLCKVIRGSDDLKDIFLVILSAVIREERERILAEVDYDVCIAKGSLSDLRLHLREALVKFQKRERAPDVILGDSKPHPRDGNEVTSVARELLSEKHHLKEMIENLSEGIVELSQDGEIVSINKAAAAIFGRTIEELTGVLIVDISWDGHGEKIKEWAKNELINRGGEVLEIAETDPLHIDDKILTAYFLPIRKTDAIFAICIFRDISRQYMAEKRKMELDNAIRLVKKMDAMSCMAGGVAHDFNNLLTIICGNLDMISFQEKHINLEEPENLVKNAREAAHVAVELIRKISCFSPFGIIQREDVDINDFVKSVIADFSRENDFPKCFFKRCEIKNFVNIDSQQIRTAILNVLQNSLEAGSDEGITVSIEKELIEEPTIRAGQYVSAGSYVKLLFSDTGRGINQENLLEIFDPYFSTKQRGTLKGMGLGLTIVYSTLRNHGGYVVVETRMGKGTDITLYLPLLKSNTILAIDDANQKKQILLVEDDDQLRSISKIMLEYLGYLVVEAGNKSEAIDVFSENQEKGQEISIAILNLTGAGKQDGIDICRALQTIKADLQVIVSSGSLLDPVMRNCREYGFSNTLHKPYTMDDLRNVLSSI